MYVDFGMATVAIKSEMSRPVCALIAGFDFMQAWHDDWAAVPVVSKAARNRCFMSDTTWQQMKTSFVTKLKFLRLHFERTPDVPVYPRRMSQSVLESLFGEIRSFSRGSACLNSAQYMQRRSIIDIKQQTAIVNARGYRPRPGLSSS
jgi:hypothetical protein